jgi:multiple sugar transport system permease protein
MATKKFHTIFLVLFGTMFVVVLVFPFYWQLITSLRNPADLFKMPPDLYLKRFSIEYFRIVFQQYNFNIYLMNSIIVAISATLLSLAGGMPAAYAFTRINFTGRDFWKQFILVANMFPIIAVATPLFVTFKSIGLINTYPGLIIPNLMLALPLCIWTLQAFLSKIPVELEQAAQVDGCNRFEAVIRVVLPLMAPGIFATSIIVFIGAWNELMFSLIFVTKNAMRTVPVAISMMPGEYTLPWGEISAASIVSTLPIIIVVLICQKNIVAGLTAGSVKG